VKVGWVSAGLRDLCCSHRGLDCLGPRHAGEARTLLQAVSAASHLADLEALRALAVHVAPAPSFHLANTVAIQHEEITLMSTPWAYGRSLGLGPMPSPADLARVEALRLDGLRVAGVDALRLVG